MNRSASKRPIGVFDSGIGGLTVFKALRARMPQEDLVYFGDTARVPYGSKSAQTIARYSLEAARFLESLRIKALVVACNTSSAVALPQLRQHLALPVIDVIGPGTAAAAAATRKGRVGIIGTEATISSGAYQKALRSVLPKVVLRAKACPLFVPLVEEGWWKDPVTAKVAARYLAPLKRARIDTLILGCTHYPLLKDAIQKTMGPSVALVDSAEQAALETQSILRGLGLEAANSRKGSSRFFVSDSPERFKVLAKRWLGGRAPAVELRLMEGA